MKKNRGNSKLPADIIERLEADARRVAANAHAPYSNFRVGAAVLGRSGKIFEGANVENASLGLGTCAERVALSAAVAAGEKNIQAIAVACIDAKGSEGLSNELPCGACRQWIQELAPDAEILIAGHDAVFTIDDLLPRPFKLG